MIWMKRRAWRERELPPSGFEPEKKAAISLLLGLSSSLFSLVLLCSYVREPGFNSMLGLAGAALVTPLLMAVAFYAVFLALKTSFLESRGERGVVRAAVIVTIPAAVLCAISTGVCLLQVLTPNEERAYAAILNYHKRLEDYRARRGTYPEGLWQLFYPVRPDPLTESSIERHYLYKFDYTYHRDSEEKPIEKYFIIAIPAGFRSGGVRILMINEEGEIRASEPGMRSQTVYDYEEAKRLWAFLRP